MDKDCIFCKIVAGEIPAKKVYDDDEFLAFLDVKPVNPGHTLLVPKAHYADWLATPDEILQKIGILAKQLSLAIKEASGADGINVANNNGAAAGQVVFHFHLHIMPRVAGDGYELWHGQPYAAGEAENVAQKIRQALQ